MLIIFKVDLALLSLCSHTIMDYGTFGLWGGLLAGGEILAPTGYTRSAMGNALIEEIDIIELWRIMIIVVRPHRDTPDLVWWRSAGLEGLTLVDVRFSNIFSKKFPKVNFNQNITFFQCIAGHPII